MHGSKVKICDVFAPCGALPLTRPPAADVTVAALTSERRAACLALVSQLRAVAAIGAAYVLFKAGALEAVKVGVPVAAEKAFQFLQQVPQLLP